MISIYGSSGLKGKRIPVTGISSYNHETLMIGGYWSASFSFAATSLLAQEWLFEGVGKHIEVYSSKGNVAWEGIVDTVALSVGGRTITAGPFLDIANRVKVVYRFPNYGLGNPLEGEQMETDWDINSDSTLRYGWLEEVVSGGEGLEDEMLALQEAVLIKNSEPKLTETISTTDSAGGTTVSVTCAGYSRILEKQIYNLPYAADPYVDLSVKAEWILNANLYFDETFAKWATVGFSDVGIDVNPAEDDDRTAWGIITDHIAKSAYSNSIVFGAFADINFVLSKEEDRLSYKRKADSHVIFNYDNAPIENSEMLPGGTMLLTDFSRPVTYRINSIRYDLVGDAVSINFHDSKLSNIMSSSMLGGF